MKLPRHVLAALGMCAPTVSGAIHNLFVGNLQAPAAIYALEFNDETNALRIVNNITADAPHGWIAFDQARKNLYASSLHTPRIYSYSLTSPTNLTLTSTLTPPPGPCANTTSAFITALSTPPYPVLSASFPGPNACGLALAIDPSTGALTASLGTWQYGNTSGIHGLAVAPEAKGARQVFYSADLTGDVLWTHALNLSSGEVTLVGRYALPYGGMGPRHVAVHPKGGWLYAVFEEDNSVAAYTLGEDGAVEREVVRHSVIPIDAETGRYKAAEVVVSPGGRYLWASVRGAVDLEVKGFVAGFLLDNTGGVVRRMFRMPTSWGGGVTNAVGVAAWSEEVVAVTDFPRGLVEVWRMEGGGARTVGGETVREYGSAKAVARVVVGDGGCCANAVWYS